MINIPFLFTHCTRKLLEGHSTTDTNWTSHGENNRLPRTVIRVNINVYDQRGPVHEEIKKPWHFLFVSFDFIDKLSEVIIINTNGNISSEGQSLGQSIKIPFYICRIKQTRLKLINIYRGDNKWHINTIPAVIYIGKKIWGTLFTCLPYVYVYNLFLAIHEGLNYDEIYQIPTCVTLIRIHFNCVNNQIYLIKSRCIDYNM